MRARAISSAQAMRRGPVIYPFVFAVSPILFVWAQNVEEFSLFAGPADFFVPASLSVGFTVLAIGLGSLILRNARKAALIVFLFLLAFYFYGHVYDLLLNAEIGVPRQRYFLLAWAAVFTVAGLLALRIRADLRGLTNTLNLVVGLLAIISLFDIAVYHLGSGTDLANNQIGETADFAAPGLDPSDLPDIYYIILDAHASSGYLERSLGYDDKRFFDYLAGKGFYVVEGGRSNYGNTTLSLASSLNMEHLIDLTVTPAEDSQDASVYNEMIRENKVMKVLRSRGYQMFHFKESWMPRAHEEYGDQYFGCGLGTLLYVLGGEFTSFLLQTTILEPVLRQSGLIASSYQSKGLCEIARLLEVRKIHGPKFVYGHLSIPHPPFVFGRDGDLVDDASGSLTLWSSRQAYLNQMIFVDKKVEEIVEQILSGPGDPPVVIIQADHGTGFFGEGFSEEVYEERFSIINALYLPAGGEQDLYPSITPVNSFRVVFNRYFDAGLKLEEDISYYTNFDEGWFNFLDVTDEAKLD